MKMRIEVYQRRDGNVRVVLHGENAGDAVAADPGVFDRYLEIWRAFTASQDPRPAISVGPSPAGSRSRTAAAV